MMPSWEATLSHLAAPPAERKFSPPNTEKKTKTATRPMNDPVSGRRASAPSDSVEEFGTDASATIFGDGFDGAEIIGPSRLKRPQVSARIPRGGIGRPLGRVQGPHTNYWASARAGLRARDRHVDIVLAYDAGPGQHRFGREIEAVVHEAVQQRDCKEALQVGLLIDREHLLAVLDALNAGLVHVERGELDLLADAGLADCVSGAIRVRGADRNEAVDARVFQKVGLDRLSHRGGVAEARRRQWQLGRLATLLRNPVGDALATVFSIGGARQGVDAEHVLDAMAAEILAASGAGHVLVAANVIHRAEALGGVHSSGVVDDQWNVRGGDLLKGGVLGLGHPVRTDDGARVLAQRGADEFGRVRPQIVVVRGA